jgi:hypothetical protein
MDIWLPWLDYPGITQEKLLIVADLVRRIRDEALDDHRPEKWETNWSLGTRQYERTEGAITWATQQYSWLTVLAGASGGPSQYVFAITGHAIRFCRGDEEEIAARYQSPCFPELQQQQSMFGPDALNGRSLRLVIKNNADGRVDSIWIMEADEAVESPVRGFLIPPLPENTKIAEFAPPTEKPVELPPVTAEPEDDAAADSEKDSKKKTGSDDE